MPYNNEYATNNANQEAMSGDTAKDLLKSFNLKPKLIPYERLDKVFIHDFDFKKVSIKNAFIIDGSKYETVVDTKFSSKLALFNINQACIDIPVLMSYLKDDFPSPQAFQKINTNHALQVIVPTEGFSNNEYPHESDFFRFALFKILQSTTNPFIAQFKNKVALPYEESLMGTYTHLFSKIGKTQLKIQPCADCNKLNHFMNIKDFKNDDGSLKWQTVCKCAQEKPVFLTDWLSIHLQLGNEISNEALTTQIMLILEKLVLINLIRNLVMNKQHEILKESVFILDGSLAIYSYASWLGKAMHEEIIELKTQNHIIVLGIEKTGSFVEHVKKVEHYFAQENLDIQNKAIFAFNDDYIKKHIRTYDNDSYYGENTHFGKKVYYKNKKGSSFILNIAFSNDADKSVLFNQRDSAAYINSIEGLEEIIWLFDNFSSQAYDNAFSLLSFAHNGAALSTSEMGKKLLTDFLQSLVK